MAQQTAETNCHRRTVQPGVHSRVLVDRTELGNRRCLQRSVPEGSPLVDTPD